MSERTKAENIRRACRIIAEQDKTMTYEEKQLRAVALTLLDPTTAAAVIVAAIKGEANDPR